MRFASERGGDQPQPKPRNQVLTPEQWQRVFAIVEASQEREEREQASFLVENCGNDAEILKAAQSLLRAQKRMGAFLDEPGVLPTAATKTIGGARTLANAVSSPEDVSEPLPRGSMLGRYVVLNLLGVGGMGVVYAAYDPELGRKLAIKLLHPEASRALLGSDGKVRLLREAQVMARLADPNVIAVHDVCTVDDEVFIAMEYVDGYTMKGWIEAQPREWREIVAMFVQAGRGLSAAHSAGIVHRDFKPENVLVGRDGRARVVDFGLARGTLVGKMPDSIPPLIDAHSTKSIGPHALPDSMTVPGTLLGTPAYMAPEQLASGEVDARTDQFSFCASLYQALYGELPFKGDGVLERLAAIREGKIAYPKASNVPGWLRRAVVKGLSAQPADRYPSIEVLLSHLQRQHANVWRRANVTAAVLSLAVLGPLASYGFVVFRQNLVCRAAEEKLAGIWDSKREEAIRQAFVATADSNALDAFNAVKWALDTQTRSWVAMRTEACRARLRGEPAEALVDLRMACLQNRLEEMRKLTNRLVQADAQVVGKAREVVSSLTPLRDCADAAALMAAPPPEAHHFSNPTPTNVLPIVQPVGQPIEPVPRQAPVNPQVTTKKKGAPRVPPQMRNIEIE